MLFVVQLVPVNLRMIRVAIRKRRTETQDRMPELLRFRRFVIVAYSAFPLTAAGEFPDIPASELQMFFLGNFRSQPIPVELRNIREEPTNAQSLFQIFIDRKQRAPVYAAGSDFSA